MTSQDIHALPVTERDTTLNPRQLRDAGFIPVTMYGKGRESVNLQVRGHEFTQMFRKGARLFKLEGYSEALTVKAHQLQVDPVRQDILNAEFLVLTTETESKKELATSIVH